MPIFISGSPPVDEIVNVGAAAEVVSTRAKDGQQTVFWAVVFRSWAEQIAAAQLITCLVRSRGCTESFAFFLTFRFAS